MPTNDTKPPPSRAMLAGDVADALADLGHPTAAAERAADETLDELAHTRRAADTPDDLTAADAWRQIATLAGRLQHQAREVAILAASLTW